MIIVFTGVMELQKNLQIQIKLMKKGDPILDENGKQVVLLGVKSVLKAQEKATAGSLLAPTDWYIVRKAEKNIAIPSDITTYRDAVRTACDKREKK